MPPPPAPIFRCGEFVQFAAVWQLNKFGSPYRIGKYLCVGINVMCKGCGETHGLPHFFMSCN